MSNQSATGDCSPAPTKRAIVFGFGPVGQMLGTILASHDWGVEVVDARPPESLGAEDTARQIEQYHHADACRPTPPVAAAVRSSSVAVLALPEQATLRVLEAIQPNLDDETLVVETLSRKDRVREHIAAAVPGSPVLSINPLFHPGLGPAGNKIAIVDGTSHATVDDLVTCIEAAGADIVQMTVQQHDEQLVPLQALTHSVLLGFARSLPEVIGGSDDCLRFAPPPTRLLLALAARVASGAPETFWDIQSATGDTPPARQALAHSLTLLDAELDQNDLASFGQSLSSTCEWFGSNLTTLTRLAEAALGVSAEDLHTEGKRPRREDQAHRGKPAPSRATPHSKEN